MQYAARLAAPDPLPGPTGILRLFAKLTNSLCTAVKSVEAYKVTAVWLLPASDSQRCYLLFESVKNYLELRLDYSSVLLHMLHKVFICAEELNVAELIYLVIADSLNCHHGFKVLDVLFR